MAYKLKLTPALVINDIIRSTLNQVSLQSKDGEKVQVSLAPLLGQSKLIRLIVDESHLHPAIHGPLTLSCDEVSAESLVSVGEILSTGETFVRDENVKEEIKQVLEMLGIEADLSLDKKTYNYEYLEQHSLPDGYLEQHSLQEYEGVNLKKEFEMMDDYSQSRNKVLYSAQQITENDILTALHEETGLNDADDNETEVDITVNEHEHVTARDESVQLEEEFETKDNYLFGLKANLTQSRENNEYNEQRITFNDILTTLGIESLRNEANYADDNETKVDVNENVSALELDSMKGDETNFSDVVVYDANDYSLKQCCINIENLGKVPGQSHHTNKNVKDENVVRRKEKPYKCQICGFEASFASTLKKHNRRHTGERPHKCKICTYSCIRSDHLKLHMVVHTGEKIFKCRKCDYVATTRYEVKKHDQKINEV